MPQIPIIDISAFTDGGDVYSREETAKELAKACRSNGCVGLAGHGVPEELLKKSFDTSQTLFDLPLEQKLKAPRPDDSMLQRGYSAVGREVGAGKGAADTDDEELKKELQKVSDYKACLRRDDLLALEKFNCVLGEL